MHHDILGSSCKLSQILLQLKKVHHARSWRKPWERVTNPAFAWSGLIQIRQSTLSPGLFEPAAKFNMAPNKRVELRLQFRDFIS